MASFPQVSTPDTCARAISYLKINFVPGSKKTVSIKKKPQDASFYE
jgi:hypothetical protein